MFESRRKNLFVGAGFLLAFLSVSTGQAIDPQLLQLAQFQLPDLSFGIKPFTEKTTPLALTATSDTPVIKLIRDEELPEFSARDFFRDDPKPIASFKIDDELPPGIYFDSIDGHFEGRPEKSGNYSIKVRPRYADGELGDPKVMSVAVKFQTSYRDKFPVDPPPAKEITDPPEPLLPEIRIRTTEGRSDFPLSPYFSGRAAYYETFGTWPRGLQIYKAYSPTDDEYELSGLYERGSGGDDPKRPKFYSSSLKACNAKNQCGKRLLNIYFEVSFVPSIGRPKTIEGYVGQPLEISPEFTRATWGGFCMYRLLNEPIDSMIFNEFRGTLTGTPTKAGTHIQGFQAVDVCGSERWGSTSNVVVRISEPKPPKITPPESPEKSEPKASDEELDKQFAEIETEDQETSARAPQTEKPTSNFSSIGLAIGSGLFSAAVGVCFFKCRKQIEDKQRRKEFGAHSERDAERPRPGQRKTQ